MSADPETPEPVAFSEALPPEPPRVKRWRDEIARLDEMIEDQKRTRIKMKWLLYVGVIVAIPTVFYHPAAPLGVMAFAFTSWATGRYFAWGHLIERGYQLRMAEIELKKELVAAGLPAHRETI